MRLIVAAHGFSTIKEFNTEQAMNLIKTMSDPAKADPYIAKPAQSATGNAGANDRHDRRISTSEELAHGRNGNTSP
jgi:hypothetical protein